MKIIDASAIKPSQLVSSKATDADTDKPWKVGFTVAGSDVVEEAAFNVQGPTLEPDA